MKIIRNTDTNNSTINESYQRATETPRYNWKVLIVDDEPDIRKLTRMSLRDFSFANRSLEFLEADSATSARAILGKHPDIALALIDVVMESPDAGLKLVEFIRQEQGNIFIRIVIRTGQPGIAPERYVIDHYDIDDYKDKTELTSTRLYTSVRSALKAYRDLQTINMNRLGLERVLQATPAIYRLGHVPLSDFFNGMLTQVIGLCQLSDSSHIGSLKGVITTIDHNEIKIRAYTEQFANSPRFDEIHQLCVKSITEGLETNNLRDKAEILPLSIADELVGYIYIEPIEALSTINKRLIHVFAKQCSQALENHQLHGNIIASFENTIDMLAEVAEYKDKATGGHVNRLDYYTRTIASAMGLNQNDAQECGKASRLHDIGKVGVPDYILAKPGKLTPEEFDIIKTHTTLGANILGHDPIFELAQQIALSHHERWDGRGYPHGVLANTLPLPVRIVSVADVFDAMISWRPYKQAWSVLAARDAIAAAAGTQFDPDVVIAFLQVLDNQGFDEVIARAGEVFN